MGGAEVQIRGSKITIVGPVDIRPLACDTDHPDLCDRSARLLGLIYGSQNQQLQQLAVTFDLITRPYGSQGQQLEQDTVTNSLTSVGHPHDDIHEGKKYIYSDIVTGLGASATQLYLFTAPNTVTRIHMLPFVESSLGVQITLFEAPTITLNGTVQTPINHNRNSLNTATLTVYKTPTVTGNGTQLSTREIGSVAASGRSPGTSSEDRNENEFVLKQNTPYLLRIVTLAANTDVTTILHWYEI